MTDVYRGLTALLWPRVCVWTWERVLYIITTTTTKIPVYSIFTVHTWWMLLYGTNTGLPCQCPWPPTLSRWRESTLSGAQAQWVLCGIYIPFIPLISTCLNVNWIPDWVSFTATGFLSIPCSSGPLSCYWQPGAERVKAVILENWGERRENVHDVFEGERFRVSCPYHSTLEDSSPVTV